MPRWPVAGDATGSSDVTSRHLHRENARSQFVDIRIGLWIAYQMALVQHDIVLYNLLDA